MTNETQTPQTSTQPQIAFCRAGKHRVEAGKSVTAQGWCNLCLKDAQRGKAPGYSTLSDRINALPLSGNVNAEKARYWLWQYCEARNAQIPNSSWEHDCLVYAEQSYSAAIVEHASRPTLADQLSGDQVLALATEYRNYRGLDDEVGYGLPKVKL